ncbi:aspartic proteinase CDR1-like [Vigna unguiculata]|uniref:Aspartyl protease family protein n=1 Tax=Vigna unguiculata TaxID=3917 RepID=A0A4D6KUM0_VIGUN|nr:aspartic proteinase CDR1-like [Vigna unguiculata]QCD81806.1 aspartyl protease family protein [Vigna unguiculata]
MGISPKSKPLYFALTLLGTLDFLILSQATTNFLIHRDSPLSPLYDPSITHFDRLHSAFQRSFKRINHLKAAGDNLSHGSNLQAPMRPGGGEYLMKILIGTPPVEVIGIADTGSDLIWTQCLPCIECYNQTIPLFNPSRSKSYRTMPCLPRLCSKVLGLENTLCPNNRTCGYSYAYADGSHTAGALAFETVTLGISNPISLPNVAFGCAHDTGGIFDASGSGIIGLSGGNLSLISQLGPYSSGGKKFSYCLIPNTMTNENSTSKINFGNGSLVSGRGVVTTPLINAVPGGFLVTLKALSVGKERIEFARKGDVTRGNMIIDTGTTFTLLPSGVYSGLVRALRKVIRAKRVRDPKGVFDLCYEGSEKIMKLPIITLHFEGGDVNLQAVNTFSWVRKDVVCLTMVPGDQVVLGNLAQTNFLVGYDLHSLNLSFKPTDCSKL